MPFYAIPATHQEQPPIFIISGILGHSIEAQYLAQLLHNIFKSKRTIYVWHDPRLLSSPSQTNKQPSNTLEEQAELIASELPAFPFQPFPILLVGYSYGCSLAVETALYLKKYNHDPHLVLIDGTSPEISQQYFLLKKISATLDLIKIINYAALLSNLKPCSFNDEEVKTLSENFFSDRIDLIVKNVMRANRPATKYADNINCFNLYVEIARQNLYSLYHYKNKLNSITDSLNKINLIITNETIQKYSDLYGGWQPYAKSTALVTNDVLSQGNHTDLLAGKTCEEIAKIIHENFTQEVTKENVFTTELNFFLQQYKKNNPDVDVSCILTNILNDQKKELSSDENSSGAGSDFTLQEEDLSPIETRLHLANPDAFSSSDGSDEHKKTNKKFPRKINQGLGLFADGTKDYNTRTKDKQRAQRLHSPLPLRT